MYARTVQAVTPASQVRNVMVWPVATVDGSANLTEVAEALAADEIGALCVTEDGRLAGIISERDVVAHVAVGADPAHLTAADVMSNDLITASPDESVLVAARRMEDAQIRHLPVLDEGQIAGIMSMRDVFTVLVDDAEESTVIVRSGTRVMVVGD